MIDAIKSFSRSLLEGVIKFIKYSVNYQIEGKGIEVKTSSFAGQFQAFNGFI